MSQSSTNQTREASPKVSVIVPVYNVEEYLGQCLQSLICQTLQEIEIIVVNDGSPDNSQVIIDSFAEMYPDRIIPYVKKNGGLSDARNYGVERAHGEYISFVDSDDWVEPEFLELLYHKALEENAEVACCGYAEVLREKTIKKFYDSSVMGQSVKTSPELLIVGNSFAWNKIYRLDFWKRNGFSYPVGQWFEDSAVTYNVMLAANKVSFVNYPLYCYRRTRQEAITKSFDPRIFDAFKSTDSLLGYYKAHGAYDGAEKVLETLCIRHITPRLKVLPGCSDKAMARKYVRQMFDFMDRHFPDWRSNELVHPKSRKIRTIVSKFIQRHKPMALFVVSMPGWMYNVSKSGFTLLKKAIGRLTRRIRTRKANERKRSNLQKKGLSVLAEVQQLLKDIGIRSFADFGTCLGLVREGHLLYHDLDMDMGVVVDTEKRNKVNKLLETKGYRLWRRYAMNGNAVEESYLNADGIRVDLNYYELTDERARTWLFYRKPGFTYDNPWTRHIVEMNYSPITGLHDQTFNGIRITLPDNPERLLEEKYGPGWRTPDKGWIYWKSPAATPLETMETFTTYSYEGYPYFLQSLEKRKHAG